MPFILDTGFLVIAREYYYEVFPSFWVKMDEVAQNKSICSVSEVKAEIENYRGKQVHLLAWINKHKNLFPLPSDQAQLCMKKVSKVYDEYLKIMGEKKTMKKDPWADPFVIAEALSVDGTVVTTERPAIKYKKRRAQGMPKIPDVCQILSVHCISPEECMEELQWVF